VPKTNKAYEKVKAFVKQHLARLPCPYTRYSILESPQKPLKKIKD
jgi:hypothetical protein